MSGASKAEQLPETGPGPAPRGLDELHSPYLGLSSFEESDRALFHGRETETEELFQLVRRETLSVVFGMSGLGKSSLLRAGLFPRLREADLLPIVVRLTYGGDDSDLVGQIRDVIRDAIEDGDIDAEPPRDDQTLWEYFHRTPLWSPRNRPLVPVLVLDQFEELFTLGADDPSRDALLTELGDLVENRIPARVRLGTDAEDLPPNFERTKAKVVLSLREDYLARLEDLRKIMPSIARGRFRLHNMDGDQAVRAVRHSETEDLVDDRVARDIVRFVAGAERGTESVELAALTVEPALLSLVCRELDARRQRRSERAITSGLLEGESELIIDRFYDRSIADLDERVGPYLESHLLTPDGHRTTVALSSVKTAPGMAAAIDPLVDRRILRIEERLGQPHVEVIHDVLTRVLLERRDEREQAHQRRRRRLIRRGIAALVVAIAAATGLTLYCVASSKLDKRAQELEAARIANARASVETLVEQARDQLSDNPWNAASLLALASKIAAEIPGYDSPELNLLLARVLRYTESLDRAWYAHDADITFIEFSPDGSRLVTASRDGRVRVWRTSDWSQLLEMSQAGGEQGLADDGDARRTSPITHAAVSWPSNRMASASDRGIVLWDLNTGKRIAQAKTGRHSATYSLSLDHSGGWIAATDYDDYRVWTVEEGKTQLARRWAPSAPAPTAELPVDSRTISFDPIDDNPAGFEAIPYTRSYRVYFRPGAEEALVVDETSNGAVWPLDAFGAVDPAKAQSSSDDERPPQHTPIKELDYVQDALFSPDGAWLWINRDYGSFEVLSTTTWAPADAWPTLEGRRVLQFSPDSQTAAVLSYTGASYHVYLVAQTGLPRAIIPISREYCSVDVQLTNTHVVVEACGAATWLSFADNAPPTNVDVPVDSFTALSAAGGRIASAHDDGLLRAWKLDAPSGDTVVSWPARTEEPVASGEPLSWGAMVDGLAVSPDGQHVVAAARDDASASPNARFRNTYDRFPDAPAMPEEESAPVLAIYDRTDTALVRSLALDHPPGPTGAHGVSFVEFNPAGTSFVSVGMDFRARVWSSSGAPLAVIGSDDDPIWFARFSPDGTRLVTGGTDGRVCAWMSDSGEKQACVDTGNGGRTTNVRFMPDGRSLVIGTRSGPLLLWRPESPGDPETIGTCIGGVDFLAVSPSGSRIATASRTGTLSVWTLQGDETRLVRDSSGFSAVHFASDGRLVGASYKYGLYVVDLDPTAELHLLDLPTWANSTRLYRDRDEVLTCAGGIVQRWDLASLHLTGYLNLHLDEIERNWCDARYAGDNIVTRGTNGSISMWSEAVFAEGAARLDAAVEHVALSPKDDIVVATSNARTNLWNASNGAPVVATTGARTPPIFDATGNLFVGTDRGGLLVWRHATSDVDFRGTDLDNPFTDAIDVRDDGGALMVDERLASRVASSADQLTDAKSTALAVATSNTKISDAAFAPTGYIAVGTDGDVFRVGADGATFERVAELGDSGHYVRPAIGGGLLAIGSDRVGLLRTTDAVPETVEVIGGLIGRSAAWDAERDLLFVAGDRFELIDTKTKQPLWSNARDITVFDSLYRPNFVAIEPGGDRVVASNGRSLLVLSLADGAVLWSVTGTDPNIYQASFAPDGTMFTIGEAKISAWDRTGKLLGGQIVDGGAAFAPEARVFVALTYEGLRTVQWTGDQFSIVRPFDSCDAMTDFHLPVWSSDGNWIAALATSEAPTRSICLWSTQTGKLAASWPAHDDIVWRLAFSPDGSRLMSLSWDRAPRVWSIPTGHLQVVLANESLVAAGFAIGVPTVVTGDTTGTLRVYDLDSQSLVHVLAPTPPRTRGADIESGILDELSGRLLVVQADAQYSVWNVRTGALLEHDVRGGAEITAAAIRPGGDSVAVAHEARISLVDIGGGETTRMRQFHDASSSVRALAFDPTGKWLASGGEKALTVWSVDSAKAALTVTVPAQITALAWSADGQRLAVGGERGFVELIELPTAAHDPQAVQDAINALVPRRD